MNLSPHFTLNELIRSDKATQLGFEEQLDPPQEVIDNLGLLCVYGLEPLRAAVSDYKGEDTPIIIYSGYRCPRLNIAVGGVEDSEHLPGNAADTKVKSMTVADWYKFAKTAGIPYDQLIYEFGTWVHYGRVHKNMQRHQNLIYTMSNGKVIITPDEAT